MENISFDIFARTNPQAVAVIDPSGERWTRGKLAALSHQLARALQSAGLDTGDVCAIAAPNCAEYLAVCLGALEAGLRVVPINWHLADGEVAFVLTDSSANAIVAHRTLGQARLDALSTAATRARVKAWIGDAPDSACVGDMPGSKCVGDVPGFARVGDMPSSERVGDMPDSKRVGDVPGWQRVERFVAPHSAEPMPPGPRGRMMAYTSATTGRPKAVRLPLANAHAARQKFIAWHRALGIEPEDRNVHLCASMLYHSAPIEGALNALHMGHCVVLLDRWTPETLLAAIERHRVTTTFLVPAMMIRLLKLPVAVRQRHAVASLRFVVHGGAACPVEVKRRMIEWWGPIIWEAYAATEAQGTIVSAEDWLRHPGTVGKPIPGSAIRILDDAGRELPPGVEGRVFIKPHNGDRFEYAGDPVKTAAAYRGELVTVGDIGYLDDEGYLFLRDRRDDLILSSGMNIYPAEIEHVLVQHPAVEDCAVIGIAHELFGQVPKAVVQPVRGARPDAALTAELLRFLSARLAPMKLPRRIEYMHPLPRDPNGKLHRRRLRDSEGASK